MIGSKFTFESETRASLDHHKTKKSMSAPLVSAFEQSIATPRARALLPPLVSLSPQNAGQQAARSADYAAEFFSCRSLAARFVQSDGRLLSLEIAASARAFFFLLFFFILTFASLRLFVSK